MKTLFLMGVLSALPCVGESTNIDPQQHFKQGNAIYHLAHAVVSSVLRSENETELWGVCRVVAAEGSNIYVPCNGVEIVLLKGDKEVTSSRADDGRFSFKVEKKQAYFIKIRSSKYQVAAKPFGPYRGGDGVTFDLNPKTTTK